MDMGETQSRLNWQLTGLTSKEATTGCTATIAISHGVTYRVVGTIIPGQMSGRRTFRAYRMTDNGNRSVPAGAGGEHRTRAAAYAQAEADLADVLRDRAAEEAKPVTAVEPMTVTASGARKIAAHLARRHASRSCCATTEGDVHDRSCQTPDAREQWAPRRLREAVQIAATVMTAAASDAPEPDPATDDDIAELVERIVRRVQYEALRMVLSVTRSSDRAAIGSIVNDAARRLHAPEPWQPDA